MIICEKNRYVFVSVPKTASISIHFSLGYGDYDGVLIPEPDEYHLSIEKAITRRPALREYFKFAFVRNPWARLFSLYQDFLRRGHQYSKNVRHEKPLLSEFKDFNDLCLNLHQSEWRNNVFFIPQWDLLSIDSPVGRVNMMDFIGKFERLSDDFATVCKKIGVKAELQSMNRGSYDTDYRKYYTDEAREAVARIYHKDISEYNYEF